MDRRRALAALAGGALAAPASLYAAPAKPVHRIGLLMLDRDANYMAEALRALGYVEGRNVVFVKRNADRSEDLDKAAAALVAARSDVIVTTAAQDTIAARRATSTIPIVMTYGLAPVETGLIASLARPGGNITGTTAAPVEVAGKSVELLREAIPSLRRLAVLSDSSAWDQLYLRETENAATRRGIAIDPVRVDGVADLQRALDALERSPPGAISSSYGVVPYSKQIIEFAARQRLPAMYPIAPAVAQGGLMAYSVHFPTVLAKAAAIVDRILKGARPADIPVEQPTRYLLSVNLGTARRLGLTLPPSVLVQAERVLE